MYCKVESTPLLGSKLETQCSDPNCELNCSAKATGERLTYNAK